MDTSPQPSAPSTPLTPPEAQVILPPEPGPTGDQTATSGVDYESIDIPELRSQFPDAYLDLSDSELKVLLPDAHRFAHRYAEAQAFQEDDGIGNHTVVLRLFNSLGAELRVADEARANYLRQLPKGAKVHVPELQGAALDEAKAQLRTRARLMAGGMLDSAMNSPEGDAWLTRTAQDLHRSRMALPALEKAAAEHRTRQEGQREQQALAQTRASVAQMSEAEYSLAYGAAWSEWHQAEQSGDYHGQQIAKARMERLGRARYQ
jgi:hypothetical protein